MVRFLAGDLDLWIFASRQNMKTFHLDLENLPLGSLKTFHLDLRFAPKRENLPLGSLKTFHLDLWIFENLPLGSLDF